MPVGQKSSLDIKEILIERNIDFLVSKQGFTRKEAEMIARGEEIDETKKTKPRIAKDIIKNFTINLFVNDEKVETMESGEEHA